jgi:two-component system nitrate/nitrite response regulator NarL
MSETPTSIILADDHPIVLQGLKHLFEGQGFVIVETCTDGDGALAAARRHPDAVLVLDLRMPKKNGIDVLRAIGEERLPCRVVLLTAALQDAEASEIVRLGARGIVLKESPPDSLVDCVRRVHRGEQWIDREVLTRGFERALRADTAAQQLDDHLTPRELEIVRLAAKGLRNREIGEHLAISEGTVKIHLHNVYEKLGVAGRLELLLYA